MRSFIFWLATFCAIGAVAGTMLRPGIPEIAIVWAVVVGLSYWLRSSVMKKRQRSSPGG